VEEAAPGSPVAKGDVIAGKYRVEDVLGQGGMGVVVAARHTELGERVALLREARAAVKIKSEHVARVSDVGRLPSGAPYMVMEFLEGQDLG
jgi:serine/threonine protein kinase